MNYRLHLHMFMCWFITSSVVLYQPVYVYIIVFFILSCTVSTSTYFPIKHISSDIYKQKNLLDNFGQLLANLFLPLFEATVDPSSHRNLSIFLNQVLNLLPSTDFLTHLLPFSSLYYTIILSSHVW